VTKIARAVGRTKEGRSLEIFAGSSLHKGFEMLVSPFAEKRSRCGVGHDMCGFSTAMSFDTEWS
jgi:hypothetical protein